MEELIKYIVNSIVEYPKDVEITKKSESSDKIEYLLSVNSEDMGRVIGKNGKVIKAIREIVRVKGVQSDKKVFLYLEE